jgi:hypothetical protein
MNFKSSGGCKACNALKSQENNNSGGNNLFLRQRLTQRTTQRPIQSYRKIIQNNTLSNLYKMPQMVGGGFRRMF